MLRTFLKTVFAPLCFALLAQPAFAQTALPIDPAVSVGALDNGLTYYVRSNPKPLKRAYLQLVVNAGSLQETEEQRGLAHFVEHLAFNGTERFQKHEIIDFMENNGMRFGADLNAYTSHNETVYKLQIPLDDPEVVEKAFMILRDWAGSILFEAEEIEKERGIVIEEWRARKGVGSRLRDKQKPFTYYQSRYAERDPIGLIPVIETAPRERFVDFYKAWYRPNLMSVIAVGDFDSAEIVEKVKAHFSDLANPPGAPERIASPVPDHDETFFSIETDPELRSSSVSVYYKTEPVGSRTLEEFRSGTVSAMYFGMLNNRLRERAQKAEPPFTGAGVGRGSLGREKDVYSIGAGLIGDDYQSALQAVMQELWRAAADGFTESEFERTKVNILRGLEKSYDERDKRESPSFVNEYTRAFLEDEAIPGLEREVELSRGFLAEISLDEVNAIGDFVAQKNSRVVLYTAPEKEGVVQPTSEQLLAAMTIDASERLAAYDDGDTDAPLLAKIPTPGTIVEQRYLEAVGVHDWKLSNGIRVLVKPTDFKNDEILIRSYSPGGSSLFSDEDIASGGFGPIVVEQSGLGAYDAIALRKKLAGKVVSIDPSIEAEYEGFRGSASPKDFETYFQLLHLYFNAPRLDLEAYASIKQRMISSIENRLKSPSAVFSDAVTEALYRGHPRHQPFTVEFVESVDPVKALEIYRDRFSDAGDYTFVFVGSIDLETMKSFAETYLATLPSTGRVETWRYNHDTKTTGQIEVTVNKNVEQKTAVNVLYHGPAVWTPENAMALGLARDVLNIRLRESLREDQSKVYSAGASGGIDREPVEQFSSGFGFTCEPHNADELIGLARAEIVKVQTDGPLDEDMVKVKQQRLRSHEKSLKENGYWLGSIITYLKQDRPLEEIYTLPDRVNEVTADQVKAAAITYYDDTNRLIAKLNPTEIAEPVAAATAP